MVWVKHVLDDYCVSTWKTIEIEMLKLFHDDPYMLWKAEAPLSILQFFFQLVETLKVWYEYKSLVVKELNLDTYHM